MIAGLHWTCLRPGVCSVRAGCCHTHLFIPGGALWRSRTFEPPGEFSHGALRRSLLLRTERRDQVSKQVKAVMISVTIDTSDVSAADFIVLKIFRIGVCLCVTLRPL